ncbi:hypothetical protein [Microvirga puerhi]|uniref:Lipoprotein n=1 Tax=Microvirga puerhi TaxID=2876078 RepID=A0ABS7VLR9_9HYPH|nr:hypothetical protein [Microvirga puerhi]MBZ6076111.1 hypothetical protein [Microvirga puerhi]
MPSPAIKAAVAAILLTVLAGCQSAGSTATGAPSPSGGIDEPGSASARVNAELDAEARAFGTAQGVASIAASMDKTGLSSIPLMVGGNAAHKAWLASANARADAAAEEDLQATYRKYGMNPDGTPSGKPGRGSAPAN